MPVVLDSGRLSDVVPGNDDIFMGKRPHSHLASDNCQYVRMVRSWILILCTMQYQYNCSCNKAKKASPDSFFILFYLLWFWCFDYRIFWFLDKREHDLRFGRFDYSEEGHAAMRFLAVAVCNFVVYVSGTWTLFRVCQNDGLAYMQKNSWPLTWVRSFVRSFIFRSCPPQCTVCTSSYHTAYLKQSWLSPLTIMSVVCLSVCLSHADAVGSRCAFSCRVWCAGVGTYVCGAVANPLPGPNTWLTAGLCAF